MTQSVDLGATYAGPVPPDLPHGCHGGLASLALAGGGFELVLARSYLYGREDTDRFTGTAVARAGVWSLAADAWTATCVETVRATTVHPVSREFAARCAAPPPDTSAALALALTVGGERFDLLLLRDDAAPTPGLRAWFDAEVARRDHERHAGDAARFEAARLAGAIARSETAFHAGDFPAVIAALAPFEASLPRAAGKRLALARARLDAPR
jgi:hypothetical protein